MNFDNRQGSVTANGFTRANGFVNAPASGSFGPFGGGGSNTGFVGGGQIGYNIQNGSFVYGIEADADYFSAGGGGNRTYANTNVYPAAGSTLTLSRGNGDGYLGTVRGRLGLAAFDRALFYVTGGLAYGDYGSTYRLGRFTNGAPIAPGATPAVVDFRGGNNNDIRLGYAIGAGVEYAFTQHVSGKVEYLYTDLGSRTYNLTNPQVPGTVLTARTDGTAQIARVGLNYKF